MERLNLERSDELEMFRKRLWDHWIMESPYHGKRKLSFLERKLIADKPSFAIYDQVYLNPESRLFAKVKAES